MNLKTKSKEKKRRLLTMKKEIWDVEDPQKGVVLQPRGAALGRMASWTWLSGSHYSSSSKNAIHFFQGRTFCQICYLNIDFRTFPWFESTLPRLAKIQTISFCTLSWFIWQVFSTKDKMEEDQNANCTKHTIPDNKMHWLELLCRIFELLLKRFWLYTQRCLKIMFLFLIGTFEEQKGKLRGLYIKVFLT